MQVNATQRHWMRFAKGFLHWRRRGPKRCRPLIPGRRVRLHTQVRSGRRPANAAAIIPSPSVQQQQELWLSRQSWLGTSASRLGPLAHSMQARPTWLIRPSRLVPSVVSVGPWKMCREPASNRKPAASNTTAHSPAPPRQNIRDGRRLRSRQALALQCQHRQFYPLHLPDGSKTGSE